MTSHTASLKKSAGTLASSRMDSAIVTALATALLVIVGSAQVVLLLVQRRQHRVELVEMYRRRWADCQEAWATIVFAGRYKGAFYQVADNATLKKLEAARAQVLEDLEKPYSDFDHDNSDDTIWATDSMRPVSELMSDLCLRVLQGQLSVSDVYPIFGTTLLRHSRPLHLLLKNKRGRSSMVGPDIDGLQRAHRNIRTRMQHWLAYHNGIRRRCLILIDLLWAEAARLEDLPPGDLQSAAEAKLESGQLNRKRLREECTRLRGLTGAPRAWKLSHFLRHAEYRRRARRIGVDRDRLSQLKDDMLDRLNISNL